MLLKIADLVNSSNRPVKNQWLEFGVPLPKGLVSADQSLVLCNMASGKELFARVEVKSAWEDRSIQWVLVKTLVSLETSEKLEFALVDSGESNLDSPQIPNSQRHAFDFEFALVDHSGKLLIDKKSCHGSEAKPWSARNTTSTFDLEDGKSLLLDVRTEWADRALLKVDVRLHNPARAGHPGGCWDLGDEGSVLFKGFSIKLPWTEATSARIETSELTKEVSTDCSLSVYQSASGGDNWSASTHYNRDGVVPLLENGFSLEQQAEAPQKGSRADPVLSVFGKNGTLSIAIPNFWQNYPSVLAYEQDVGVILELFPERFPDVFELQAGESKTHTFYVDVSDTSDALGWVRSPLVPVIDKELIEHFDFSRHVIGIVDETLLQLVGQALEESDGFEAKAERIDEYGWRNFGDLYADHETHYQSEGEEPFVSHYNNQYDAVMGFAMQYLRTGDKRWYTLMDNLAKHVVDIDIYQTERDRAEYNNGLFWHTDHYLHAHTATHRTFSVHNDTSSTPGQTGGGPGTEHCYASGLAWHYYLTGNERSKGAVLGLASWMICLHEGGQGFLSKLSAFKKFDLKRLKSLKQNRAAALYRLPFTRGTGNYINVALDAFMVTGDQSWIRHAESIIGDCIHFNDDIDARDLGNIEETWSYVILLQAIRRYLTFKESFGAYDQPYWFARRSLMHYVAWMAENEVPYLDKADTLEFPNATWFAQEVRKYWLLASTLEYAGANAALQNKQAQFFLNYLVTKLRESPERSYTRIIVLLLQNFGCFEHTNIDQCRARLPQSEPEFRHPCAPTKWATFFSVLARGLKALKAVSIKQERAWLRAR